MKLRELLKNVEEHLDDEVLDGVLDFRFKQTEGEDEDDCEFCTLLYGTGLDLLAHTLRLSLRIKKEMNKQDSKPTDELVKS